MINIVQDTINSAYNRMANKVMSMPSIQEYIRHLPIIGIEEGYSKEIYTDTAKCIIAMWKYAQKMNFISPDTSFMDFMGNSIGFRKLYKGNELKYKLRDGRIVDWKEYLEPLRKLSNSLLKDQ